MLPTQEFIEALDAAVNKNAMLSHPFYQAWNEGKLTIAILQEYAKQYFAQVKAFPTYVSGVHSQCDDLQLRRELLDNLNEEEGGADNHPELWLRFAEALGCDRGAVESADILESTQASVDSLNTLTKKSGIVAGLAALYAYESQIPEVAKTKRTGLKQFYDIDSERGVQFFSVHETADVWHQKVERDALARMCDTEAKQQEALSAAEAGSKALWGFLDGMLEQHPELHTVC